MTSPRARKLNPTEIDKLLDVVKTPRVKELELLQSFYESTQYAGRPSFFEDDVPMQERAPCVIYKLCAAAIESNCAFALGESKFPTVMAASSEDDSTFDDDLGLDEKSSQILDSFNTRLIDIARLEQAIRQAYRMAQAAKSVAIVLGFRAGLPFADLVWSKLCTPEFKDPLDPYKVTKLTIRYRYTEMWRDPLVTTGEWWTRVSEYLRVIDDTADTIYDPVVVWDLTDSGAVEGSTPVQSATKHGFGLCPVHWYARNRESLVGVNPDGKALHDRAVCSILERIDMSLSQRHRAATYAGDPQLFISGVDSNETFGGEGRRARPSALADAGQGREWNKGFSGPSQGGKATIRRGAGQVWRTESIEAKAQLLVLPEGALASLENDAKDLIAKACDGMGVVMMDPSLFQGAGDLSGRTLSFLFSKQINLVGQDREDLARCCILPVLNLFYRMLLTTPKGIYLPGLAKVLPILKPFYRTISGAAGAKVWFCPSLKLKWGDYFDPSDLDEQTRVTTATTALDKNIITRATALEHLKSVFAIVNTDKYLVALDAEVKQKQADALANAQAMVAAQPPGASIPPGTPKGAPSGKPSGAPPPKGASSSPDRGNAKPKSKKVA